MLFLTSLIFAAISAVTSVTIIVLLHYTSPAKKENWGHISQALIFHQVCNTMSILLEKGRKKKMLIFHTRCASTCYFWTRAKTTSNSGDLKCSYWFATLGPVALSSTL